MSQRAKRQQKIPKNLNEYVLGTKEHSKHDMECSDEGDENITFIPPKIAKLNKDPNELFKDAKIELNLVPSSQFEPNDNNPERFIVFGCLAQ